MWSLPKGARPGAMKNSSIKDLLAEEAEKERERNFQERIVFNEWENRLRFRAAAD